MSWYEDIMRLFHKSPTDPVPPPVPNLKNISDSLHERIKLSLDKNKDLHYSTTTRSLDQVERAMGIASAAQIIMNKLTKDEAALHTAEEAWQLVSQKGGGDEGH